MNIYERSIIEVPDGIIHNNVERLEELNERIHNRIIPDNNVKLNPVFDIKSKNDTHYKIEENFAPIQTKGPFINFVSNVDKESHLRNQIYALQHGAEQSVYVPSSKSDLYNTSVPLSSVNIEQPFTGLFERNREFVTTQNEHVNKFNIGRDVFHNNTKVQLRTNVSEYR
jgi:hypothetical protein